MTEKFKKCLLWVNDFLGNPVFGFILIGSSILLCVLTGQDVGLVSVCIGVIGGLIVGGDLNG